MVCGSRSFRGIPHPAGRRRPLARDLVGEKTTAASGAPNRSRRFDILLARAGRRSRWFLPGPPFFLYEEIFYDTEAAFQAASWSTPSH